MDLKKWTAEELRKHRELISRCLGRLARGEKISILEHLAVEFKNLKGKSYGMWAPPNYPELAEAYPNANLGTLLNSSLYDHILVPINLEPDKATFVYRYGLSENSACRVSFSQFLNFIRSGRLKPFIVQSPEVYSRDFYEHIFKACEQQKAGYLPPLVGSRVSKLMQDVTLVILAATEGIEPTEDFMEIIATKHPEYDLLKCVEEITKACSKTHLEGLARHEGKKLNDISGVLGTRVYALRTMGFEDLAQVGLNCLRVEPHFGSWVLHNYDHFLVTPVSQGILGFTNYCEEEIDNMLFLRLITDDLAMVWKEIFSSSPAASSIASPQVRLDTVELRGDDLIRFIEAHPEKELKSIVKGINTSLGEFDALNAMKGFRRFEEVVTERYNKEIRDLAMKARVIEQTLRFGKSFLNRAASLGASFLAAAMVAAGQFQWLPAIFGGAVVAKCGEFKLNEIKAEDIVKWWSNVWPFSDPGLPFVLWKHSLSRQTQQN